MVLRAVVIVVDTMLDWDEEKLEEVVKQKHAESDLKKPKTEIVTLYFYSSLCDMCLGARVCVLTRFIT